MPVDLYTFKTDIPTNYIYVRPQKVDVQERDKNMKWQHAGRSDVPSETGGDSEKKEGGKGGGEGREVGGGSRPTGQLPPGQAGIFKYLHSKYGTPLEQLKQNSPYQMLTEENKKWRVLGTRLHLTLSVISLCR